MNILLIEDSIALAEALAELLKADGYHVELAHNGREGMHRALEANFDAIILDIMLPGLDGISVIKYLRTQGVGTPTILISARTQTHMKVKGLDAGADDYLAKPFDNEELLARLRALVRRSSESISERLVFEDLVFDLEARELSSDSHKVQLSKREADVLTYLMMNAGHVVPKEEFIKHVWSDDASDASSNNLEAYISFLRKKFKRLGTRLKITSIRMLGYRLELNHDGIDSTSEE